MLDDWTSSGIEIAEQQRCFLQRHPELRSLVQLAIANEEEIKWASVWVDNVADPRVLLSK